MKKLTINDYEKLNKFSKFANYEEYNSNIVTMLMWNHHYEIFFKCYEHYALFLVKYPNHDAWLMPLCEEKYLEEALIEMKNYSKKHQINDVIHGMNEKVKTFCEQHEIPFIYSFDEDACDYIYDIEMHKTLSGKKMQKRRNHYNAFLKQYEGNFEYHSLSKNDQINVFEFLEQWKQEHKDSESIEIEIQGIRELFEYYDELHLKGGCIYINHELKGFNIYSELSDRMIQMHVDKTDKNIRGLSIALLKYTLQECDEKYTLMNREDDMGLSYLRKAKNDMVPIYKVKKYTAISGSTHISKASENDFNQILQLWKNSFEDEDFDSTSFYFHHLYNPSHTYLLKYNDTILSMLQVRYITIQKENTPMKVALIVGVATHPDYQKCGYMRILLEYVLELLGETVVFIQAYNWDLYRRFGFSEAYTYKKSFYESLGDYNGTSCHDAKHLLSIYNDYVLNKDGYRIRDMNYYEDFFLPYHASNYEIIANEDAYIVVDKNHTCVSECIYRNIDSLLSLLNRFQRIEVHADVAFQTDEKCHEMMVKGTFERNDFLFIHESF